MTIEELRAECGLDECDDSDDYMVSLKGEVAWVLGLEPDSDEWYELMDI